MFEVVGPGASERDGRDRLALRVHRRAYRTAAQIRSELYFLQALAPELQGTRIDAPRPVASRSGDLVVEVPGAEPRCCDVLTWVDGRVLRPTRGLGRRSCYLLGEGLARLHNASRRFERPPGFDLPRWDSEMFSPASPFRPGPMDEFIPAEAWDLFRHVEERTRAIFQELDQARESWGIIHADFILLNCHFTRIPDGWELGVIDFDDLGWGYYLYDLAPLLGNLADFPESYGELSRAFLSGYRSIEPLPDALESHLPVLMAARHAVTLAWLSGLHRWGETDIEIDRHIEYRTQAMRDCLARS